MFNNPISYAGYPPKATSKPNKTNSTVRAATTAEKLAGTKTNVYLTPATAAGASLAPSVAGATPLVNNSRQGQVSYTDTITAGGYTSYVMTNSLITAASVIQACAICATATSGVLIQNITPGAGTVTFRVFNAGAGATVLPLIINYEIYN